MPDWWYLDALANAFSVCNGLFLICRFKEQWLPWIGVALVEAVMWILSGQYIMLILSLGYLMNSLYGLIKWHKYTKAHPNANNSIIDEIKEHRRLKKLNNAGDNSTNYLSENYVYSVDNNYQWGFGVYNTPTQPDPNDLSTYNPFVQGTYWSPSKWRDYVTSYPMLIQNRKDVTTSVGKELNYSAHRCVWGWTDTKLFNITIEGNGATFSEIKQIVRTLYPSVEYCANLDGGGSVCALVDGKKITDEGWERPVDSVVCVWVLSTAEEEERTRVEQSGFDAEKPEDTEDVKEDDNTSKKLYRVQLGAFSVETNCKNFLSEIQKIKTGLNDYSNAYMRKVGNLWKVQVGAFSVKANAERMAKDLEVLGYSTYITTN